MKSVVSSADPTDETRAAAMLAEYCDALGIVVRNTLAEVRRYLAQPGGLWLAHADTDVVGCIALRPLPGHIAEIKRLYVRPTHRCRGLAHALLDALEAGALERGFPELCLDTHDGLRVAVGFYERRGYTRCERYNDNPQATIFMRRRLL